MKKEEQRREEKKMKKITSCNYHRLIDLAYRKRCGRR